MFPLKKSLNCCRNFSTTVSKKFPSSTPLRYNKARLSTEQEEEQKLEEKTKLAAKTEDEEYGTYANINQLKKINDESAKILEEITQLSTKRSEDIIKEIKSIDKGKVNNLNDELLNFFHDYIGNKEKFAASGKSTKESDAAINFPFLRKSYKEDPYTEQELYLRRMYHARTMAKLGSDLKDVYRAFKDLSNPEDYKKLTISKLMAAGAHLGQSTSLWVSATQPYIYGEYEGIHIIDLEQTLSHLRRASKIVEGVAKNGGVILFIGTAPGQKRSVQKAAKMCNGYYVSERWIPGTLTNSTEITAKLKRKEIYLNDEETERELTDFEKGTVVKPDLIVILNLSENMTAIKEAIQTRIPTIGLIDTDCEPSFVTYPIPTNDDSIRATNLICGVLGKAGKMGRERRLNEVAEYFKEKSTTTQKVQQL